MPQRPGQPRPLSETPRLRPLFLALRTLCIATAASMFATTARPSTPTLKPSMRYFYSRAASIYGGTSEVQKDILARTILG